MWISVLATRQELLNCQVLLEAAIVSKLSGHFLSLFEAMKADEKQHEAQNTTTSAWLMASFLNVMRKHLPFMYYISICRKQRTQTDLVEGNQLTRLERGIT
jgi:hypothetical protein